MNETQAAITFLGAESNFALMVRPSYNVGLASLKLSNLGLSGTTPGHRIKEPLGGR